tara:strand:+ start:4568 stop:5449 length:882 start_codon:yes stop_codon:yes gene_type:complete
MKQKERDFIDFIIELIDQRKVFYLILAILLSIATYFQVVKNTGYSFNTHIKNAEETTYTPVMSYLNIFRKKPSDTLNKPFEEYVTYEVFSDSICDIILNSSFEPTFYYTLSDAYMASEFYEGPKSLEARQEVYSEIKDSIVLTNKVNYSGMIICSRVKVVAEKDLVDFLYGNYVVLLNEYIGEKITSQVRGLQEIKQSEMKSILENYYETTKPSQEDYSEYTNFVGKLNLVKNYVKPDTGLYYILSSETQITRTLSPILLYLIFTFFAFIFFIISVVMMDFSNQYSSRKLSKP